MKKLFLLLYMVFSSSGSTVICKTSGDFYEGYSSVHKKWFGMERMITIRQYDFWKTHAENQKTRIAAQRHLTPHRDLQRSYKLMETACQKLLDDLDLWKSWNRHSFWVSYASSAPRKKLKEAFQSHIAAFGTTSFVPDTSFYVPSGLTFSIMHLESERERSDHILIPLHAFIAQAVLLELAPKNPRGCWMTTKPMWDILKILEFKYVAETEKRGKETYAKYSAYDLQNRPIGREIQAPSDAAEFLLGELRAPKGGPLLRQRGENHLDDTASVSIPLSKIASLHGFDSGEI